MSFTVQFSDCTTVRRLFLETLNRLFAFSFIYQMNANHQVFKSNFETLSESLIKKTMTQQTQEMELIATAIIILDDEDESFIEDYNKQQYGIKQIATNDLYIKYTIF